MRYLKIFIVLLISFIPLEGFSQVSLLSLGVWNLTSLNGEIKLGGLYGLGNINSYGINNKLTTKDYYGGIMLNTSSYIWNPNFMTFNIDGGYYPESRTDLYLVTPNIYNAINTSKLHMGATLFPRKVISLSGHLNYDNSYDSRENLTDIKTNSKSAGANFSYRNSFLPITVSYNQSNWDSKEVQTGRDFYYNQKVLNGHINKSFGKKDRNEFTYTHNDYFRQDYGLYGLRDVSDNFGLLDGYYLDSAHRSQITSNILGTIQTGADSFKQWRANENFFYKLPYNLTYNINYGYFYITQPAEELQQQNVSTSLSHQLFESLHSGVLFEYDNALESTYHEINDKLGLNLNYTKKTFADGLLNIMYSYTRVLEKRSSSSELINIINEQYTVSDRVVLKRPYVNTSTIIIKDVTGTVIYQVGIDYVIDAIGDFVEIQRIPGGQIQDNASIYVSYTATQPGDYHYDINMNNFVFNWSVFNHFIDVYYKTNRTGYDNLHNASNLLLDYLTEDIVGGSLKYKSATGGVEYDNYQSTLIPFTMTRYYLTWQGKIKNKFIYTINGNWRDYKLPTDPEHRIYKDLNGMMSYSLGSKSKIDLNIGYQSQQGRQIDLDLFTMRAKYSTNIRQLTCSVGVDSYNRIYLDNQVTDYVGVYIQVLKKFKY